MHLAKRSTRAFYEVNRDQGIVYVGDCIDTPRFAVEAIGGWWFFEGLKRYGKAHRLLILADAGGSNSYRPRAWNA
ncbi:MAG: ISAzo13-like element transposase-related protein [Burkholderiaceae bacterium]